MPKPESPSKHPEPKKPEPKKPTPPPPPPPPAPPVPVKKDAEKVGDILTEVEKRKKGDWAGPRKKD